jgi:hypothetical protein
MATEPEDPTPEAPATDDGEARVEGQPDKATVIAEFEAMFAKGELPDPAKGGQSQEAQPAEGELPDKPSDKPEDKPEEPKPEESKPEEPPISAARKILAAADREKRAALETLARARGLEEKAKLADTFVDALLADPEAFLAKHGKGKTFEDLIDAHLAAGTKPAPTESDEVKELRRRLDERDAKEKADAVEREVADLQTRIHTMVREAKNGDAAKFPRLAKADTVGPFAGKAYDLVTDLIAETARLGKVLDPLSAATEIEAFFAELASGEPTPKPSDAPAAPKPTPRTASAPPTRAGTQTLLNNEIRDTPPASKELPVDLDERRAVIEADMRREGLIP